MESKAAESSQEASRKVDEITANKTELVEKKKDLANEKKSLDELATKLSTLQNAKDEEEEKALKHRIYLADRKEHEVCAKEKQLKEEKQQVIGISLGVFLAELLIATAHFLCERTYLDALLWRPRSYFLYVIREGSKKHKRDIDSKSGLSRSNPTVCAILAL